MGAILVTNDDGIDSPTLVPLVRALGEIAEVRVVVPDRERSWISKAITRWGEIRVERTWRQGFEIFTVDGFPADCTNLAVHSLLAEAPIEMVVAGINLGLNAGLGFFLSSGTVGAAAEGWIAGLPAIAFSLGIYGRDRAWKGGGKLDPEDPAWQRAAELCADIVCSVRAIGFPEGTDLLNVNFPLGAGPETPRAVTTMAAVGYDRLFRRSQPGVYVHDYAGGLLRDESLAGSDLGALARGWVSIAPVRLAHTAELSPEARRRLEQPAR